jgi:carbamate kinase
VIRLLADRLDAVVTYGAGGCPTCHDGELRGAIAIVRGLLTSSQRT